MGLLQKIIKAIVPASTFSKMEAESRKWMLNCRACSAEQNIWDLGGLRYGSAGGKSATRVRCLKCDKNQWRTAHYSG